MYNDYPFKLNYTSLPPGVYNFKSINNVDLKNIGISILETTKNFIATISCISLYNNNEQLIYKKDISCFPDKSYKIDCDMVNEAFIYSIEQKSYPYYIETIIHIDGCACFKWRIKIGGDLS